MPPADMPPARRLLAAALLVRAAAGFRVAREPAPAGETPWDEEAAGRPSIETIPLALPARRSSSFEADAHPPLAAIGARRSSTFEVDALRPLAAIEDQGRRKSSSTRP